MSKTIATALLCCLTATLASCAGEGPAPDTSTAWFAVLQRDIFDQNCTSGPCHNPQAVAGGLVLSAGQSYGSLVGVDPQNGVALDEGWLRVAPFDPDASFLLRKLLAPGPGEGSRMPQGAEPLSQADINFIRDWILEGAPGPETPGPSTATPTATDLPLTATATALPATATATGNATTPTATAVSTTSPNAETPTPTEPAPTNTPQPTAPPTVSLEQVQEAIFSPRCAVQFCHSGDFPSAGLNLEDGQSFAELVGVVPLTPAAANAGLLLVEPGNPDDSFLYIKIVGPTTIEEGARMPLLGDFLTEEETALVRDWILTVAP